MKTAIILVLFLTCIAFTRDASAQNLDLSLGWAHATGDNGVDGLDLGIAAMFTSRVGVALNWDDTWDTSRIGAFELESVGQTSVKTHLQNFIVGPRVYFTQKKIKEKYVLTPFGEAQFGLSHLSTKIQQQTTGEQSSSDTAFTWMIGAGADYVIASHWAARANLDLLRTHFVDVGQSRLRFVLGIAYTIRRR